MSPLPLDTLLANVDGMRRLARRLVADPALAEDVAQDAVLVALSKGPRHGRNLRGWLNGIVRNVARESRRREARRSRHEGAAPVARPTQDPLDQAVQIAEQKRLLEAVASLSEPYRTAVWQRYFLDRTPRHIARDAKVPVETVRTWLKRARAMLRASLDAAHGGERRAWALGLAPVALSGTSWALPPLIGGVFMTTKMKAVALAALVLLVAGGLLWLSAADRSPTDTLHGDALLNGERVAGETTEGGRLKGRARVATEVPETGDEAPISISGLVVDEFDRPFAGADVRAGVPAGMDIASLPVVARTGPDGRFSILAPLYATDMQVVAQAAGRRDALARVHLAARKPLVLRLPPAPAYVFRMLDAETDLPLEGVRCAVRRSHDGRLWEHVWLTDAKGRVTLQGSVGGELERSLSVRVTHPGFRPLLKLARPRLAGGYGTAARPRDVYLTKAPSLRISTVNAAGRPVAGVRVQAWAGMPSLGTKAPEWRADTIPGWSDGSGHGFVLGDAVSDNAGQVIFPAGPRELQWFAYATGEGMAGLVQGGSVRRAQGVDATIELQPTTRIAGRVTDGQGAPVAGARVECTPWYIAEKMRKGGRIPTPPDECLRHWRTMTDAEGRYVLEQIPAAPAPAELFVSAGRGDLGSAYTALGAVSGMGETQTVDLVLKTDHDVRSLSVVDEEGVPIAGALVTFSNMLPGRLTDAEGIARLVRYPGVTGPYRAFKKGYVIGSVDGASAEGTTKIVLARTHALRGRVLDSEGTPHAAYVDVYAPEVADLPEAERNQLFTPLWYGRSHAGGAGHFRLDDLPSGPYFVRCWYTITRVGKHHTVIGEVLVTGDGPVELRLPEVDPVPEATAVIEGTVFDEAGVRLTDYWVTLRRPKRALQPTLRGRRFRFEDVPPGEWRLQTSAESGAQRTEKLIVLRPGETIQVQVVMGRSLTVQGRLVDESGKGLANTWVYFTREGEPFSSGSRRTGPDGRFEMKNLLPGRYRARTRRGTFAPTGPEPYVISDAWLDVGSGAAGEMVVRAHPGGTLTLSMDDDRFLPYSQQWHQKPYSPQKQRSGFSRVVVTTASGELLMDVGLFHGLKMFPYPLAPGSYDIVATSHEDGSFRTSFTIKAGEDTQVVVRLEK